MRSFLFKGYRADLEKGEVLFDYGFEGDEPLSFTEKVSFPPVSDPNLPQNLLKSVLDGLSIILGISYWKLYAPSEIRLESVELSREQADFWNTVWTKGLGEFSYKNKLDFKGLIKFPSAKQNSEQGISFARKNRVLLGLGGGKDSIVAAEMLKKENRDFDIFTVGTSKIQSAVAQVLDKTPIIVKRQLDPKLFELNKKPGVYNGHIPVSVIYAFLGMLSAVLYDYGSVVVGNEKSANYGNVEYLGEIINHQWSKSEEFEKLFQDYVNKFITPSITYSSPLRNLNELEVTKEFVKYPQY